jgi:hypothetical protein
MNQKFYPYGDLLPISSHGVMLENRNRLCKLKGLAQKSLHILDEDCCEKPAGKTNGRHDPASLTRIFRNSLFRCPESSMSQKLRSTAGSFSRQRQ